MAAIEWYKDLKTIDGIMYIGDIPYYSRFCYPFSGRAFLSTITLDHVMQHPYLSYSDQDMGQAL